MLSEINQAQKNKQCLIHLYEVLIAVQFIEIANRMWFPGEGKGGMESSYLMGTESSIGWCKVSQYEW